MPRRLAWIAPSFVAIVSVVLVGALAPGCAEDEPEDKVVSPGGLAAQQCAQLVACNCGVGGDAEACTDSLAAQYENDRMQAEAAGLEYDADCASRQVDWIDEVGCAIQADDLIATASCALNCPLWHGYAGPGENCSVVANRATTCAAGLDCVGGICMDICANWRLAEGALCYDPVNPPTGVCVSGTHCDINNTNRCIPTPGRGEPCPNNVCMEGDWCDTSVLPEAICTAVGGVGAACDDDDACETAPYPGIGESCSGECAGDLYCQSGTCTVKQALGQSCDFNLPCSEGLVCNGNVCEVGQPLVCFGGFF
jgi:hypothetical protein